MIDPALVLGFALRAALVLAFAWFLTAAMHRASAAARHLAWTCAIAAAALVPVAALFAPDWEVTSPVLAFVAPDPAAAPKPTGSASHQESSATRARTHDTATRTAFASLDDADMGLIIWVAGTLGAWLYVAAGLLGGWRLRRSALAGAASIDEARVLAEALEIPRPVTVVQCGAATTPMVCGIWRPVILLPSSAASWPEPRRHVVLLHELAHVKRRDCLTQLLAQIVCAVYWFNPLVWIAARRLRTERERACDDVVLATGVRGSEYATHLLEIAQATQPARFYPVAAASMAMARRTHLEGRLMAILDPAVQRSSAFYTRILVASAVAIVSVPVAAIHLVEPRRALAEGAVADPPGITLTADAPAAGAATPAAQAAAPQPPPRATNDDRLRQTLSKSLIETAGDGDLDGVDAMLTAGADVNAQVDGDGSPLIAAAGDGHLDVVRLLLDKGADPNLIVPGDGTALIAAAADGHTAVVNLLLQRGAQVNLVAGGDETALIQASGDGHLDVVKLLVSRGGDVNLGVWADRWVGDGRISAAGIRYREPELRTPLSQARGDGHVEVVRFLISAGARD